MCELATGLDMAATLRMLVMGMKHDGTKSDREGEGSWPAINKVGG
jgi:hypothetical protein